MTSEVATREMWPDELFRRFTEHCPFLVDAARTETRTIPVARV